MDFRAGGEIEYGTGPKIRKKIGLLAIDLDDGPPSRGVAPRTKNK